MLTIAQYRADVAAEMTEAVLQSKVIALARSLGWLEYHTHDSRRSRPGFPDLVLVHEGHARLLYRELKREKGKVSPAQAEWLRLMAGAGADVAVWRPLDLLERRIEAELRGTG